MSFITENISASKPSFVVWMLAYYVIFSIFFIKNWIIGFLGSTYSAYLVDSCKHSKMEIVWGVKKLEYIDMRLYYFGL